MKEERVSFQIAPRFVGVDGRIWPWPGTPTPETDVLLRIRDNDGNIMVDVLPSGRVILTEHYDADMTARRFWGSLMWFAEQHDLHVPPPPPPPEEAPRDD